MTRDKSEGVSAATGVVQKPRAAYYEDYAKPVLVNWPFMLVATAALFIVGHLASRRSGRRLGGDVKKKPSAEESSDGSRNSNGIGGSAGRPGAQNISITQLRALRAEAAEARLRRGAANSSPAAAKPTPLGQILLLGRKVDILEQETSQFLGSIKDGNSLDSKGEKEHSRLLELLTQVQLEIDAVQSDESVRPHRRIQTNRVQKLILSLEQVEKQRSSNGVDERSG